MTDQTQPEIPGAEDALKPVDPPFEGSGPKTVTPPKKRAAKKAAAPEPTPEPEKVGGLYLPALPEGYAYTRIDVTGPTAKDSLSVCHAEGEYELAIAADDLDRLIKYPTLTAGIKGMSQAAKNLVKRAARKAELEALDAEFGE